MRAKLIELLATAEASPAKALLIKPETLAELLKEVKEMCKVKLGTEGLKVTPNPMAAGFSFENTAGDGDVATPYIMSDAGFSVPNEDTWDRDAPPDGTAGVVYRGVRLHNYAHSAETTTDDNGDVTDWILQRTLVFRREMVFSSTGNIASIGPEVLTATLDAYIPA